jgi:hypothetical protein
VDLTLANLTGANLTRAIGLAPAPVMPHIDVAILAAIEAGGTLEMDTWHTCDSTHCRAGWAVMLAGDAGRALENKVGTSVAAALIYNASRPGHPVPDWFASNEETMADIQKWAKLDPITGEV